VTICHLHLPYIQLQDDGRCKNTWGSTVPMAGYCCYIMFVYIPPLWTHMRTPYPIPRSQPETMRLRKNVSGTYCVLCTATALCRLSLFSFYFFLYFQDLVSMHFPKHCSLKSYAQFNQIHKGTHRTFWYLLAVQGSEESIHRSPFSS
jgi:hypothetical protein